MGKTEIMLAKVDDNYILCPHCRHLGPYVSSASAGFYECDDCNKTYEIREYQLEWKDNSRNDIDDLKEEIEWLKKRVLKLERELGYP